MIARLIDAAICNRWLVMVMVMVAGFVALGWVEYKRLPIDAVPDITNVQV